MQFCEYLKSLGACESAIAWVGEKTREYAIAECNNLGWLLWLLVHEDRPALSALAKEFAERAKVAAAGSSAQPPLVLLLTEYQWQLSRTRELLKKTKLEVKK